MAPPVQPAMIFMRKYASVVLPLIEYQLNIGIRAKEMIIPAKNKAIVPTDISIALPAGTYGRVAPRSGLAVKNFIDVGAGVVDSDYRGPLGVVLFNFSDVDFKGGVCARCYYYALGNALTTRT